MSLFKTSAVVLQVHKQQEKENIYTIFSSDYGKIRIKKKFSKREKNIDIGYIIRCEIDSKPGESIHKVRNIDITGEFSPEGKNFSTIESFLKFLTYIKVTLPDGGVQREIFGVLTRLIHYEKISEWKIQLAKWKVQSILGDFLEGKTEQEKKLFRFVEAKKFDDIVRLKEVVL